MEERIQKFLASRGLASRREIEQWISEGRLYVNGKLAELGQKVRGDERFSLDRHRLNVAQAPDEHVQVLMYHKAPGEICSRKDPQGRRSIFDHLPPLKGQRWISIGRLDLNTQGLILLTNNGDLAHRCMHPSAELEREYHVRVLGEVSAETLKQLCDGVMLEDGEARFLEIHPQQGQDEGNIPANQYFNVILQEGRNREVRRLWEAVGCQVSRLKRVRFGPIALPRDLRPGQARLLTPEELRLLRQSLRGVHHAVPAASAFEKKRWRRAEGIEQQEYFKKELCRGRGVASEGRVRRKYTRDERRIEREHLEQQEENFKTPRRMGTFAAGRRTATSRFATPSTARRSGGRVVRKHYRGQNEY